MTDRVEAEQAYTRLAASYARAMDSNEPERLDHLYTDDVVIEGPGFRTVGPEPARASPSILRQMYARTQHLIHNQTLEQTGPDEAIGETYCTASHASHEERDGRRDLLVWAVRYQDRLRRVDGAWRFSERSLVIDWSELRRVSFGLDG